MKKTINLKNMGKLLIFLAFLTLFIKYSTNQDEIDSYIIDDEFKLSESSHPIRVFNLSRPLEPAFLYNSISCRMSTHDFEVRTLLCPHDISNDAHVSSDIISKI